jgi:hypothetical protein
LEYFDGSYVVKMKGYNQKNITYDEIHREFYKNNKIIIKNFNYIEKKNLRLTNKTIEKAFDLAKYDKRVFINNKKDTIPLLYKNFEYK